MARALAVISIFVAVAFSGCGPGENDYSAYATAGGPQCGNNNCEAGDLCVDPDYNDHQGLCRRTPR